MLYLEKYNFKTVKQAENNKNKNEKSGLALAVCTAAW